MTKTNSHMIHLEYLNACNCVNLFTLETLWIHYRSPLKMVTKQHINCPEPHGIILQLEQIAHETNIAHFTEIGIIHYRSPLKMVTKQHVNCPEPHGIILQIEANCS